MAAAVRVWANFVMISWRPDSPRAVPECCSCREPHRVSATQDRNIKQMNCTINEGTVSPSNIPNKSHTHTQHAEGKRGTDGGEGSVCRSLAQPTRTDPSAIRTTVEQRRDGTSLLDSILFLHSNSWCCGLAPTSVTLLARDGHGVQSILRADQRHPGLEQRSEPGNDGMGGGKVRSKMTPNGRHH